MKLTFIETPVFTAQVRELLNDDDYRVLQQCLLLDPRTGDVIPGTSGCRKMRWRRSGSSSGKRGGVRVIYVFRQTARQIVFLLVYDHREVDDLTASQRKQLSQIVSQLG